MMHETQAEREATLQGIRKAVQIMDECRLDYECAAASPTISQPYKVEYLSAAAALFHAAETIRREYEEE